MKQPKVESIIVRSNKHESVLKVFKESASFWLTENPDKSDDNREYGLTLKNFHSSTCRIAITKGGITFLNRLGDYLEERCKGNLEILKEAQSLEQLLSCVGERTQIVKATVAYAKEYYKTDFEILKYTGVRASTLQRF